MTIMQESMYKFLVCDVTLATEQAEFLHVFFSIVGIIVLVTIATWLGSWLRPHKPNSEKLTTYESEMEPIGHA